MSKWAPDVSGSRPGGGDGRETRDAIDDKAMVSLLGAIYEAIVAQSGTASVGALAAQEYSRSASPVAPAESRGADPTGTPMPVPVAAEAAPRPDLGHSPGDAGISPPFGPEGPRLGPTYQPADQPLKPESRPGIPKEAPEPRGVSASQSRDYTPKLDEIIRLLGKIGTKSVASSAASAGQPSGGGDGSATESVTTDNGSGTVTTRTTHLPGPMSHGSAGRVAPGEFGPEFGYGTQAYPWTNQAAKAEALGRFAADNIAGIRPIAGAFTQAHIDFNSILRPSLDRNPYAILKGDRALDERLASARDDLASHQKSAPSATASDDEKDRYHDALKRKQSALDALEAHKEARADSVEWAKTAAEQFGNTAHGRVATKIAESFGLEGEMAAAGAASALSRFGGIMLAAPVAIAQFEKSVVKFINQGRQTGLQQADSLGQYAMATPIAGELAHFNVSRMMRDIQVGYDVSDSSRRFLRYATDVEMKSRFADAADVRMKNQAATFGMGMYDEWLSTRKPLDDLWKRHTDNEKFDRFAAWAGRRTTDLLTSPVTLLATVMKAIRGEAEEEKKDDPENPWLKYLRYGAEVGPTKLAPPIPPPPSL